MDGTVRDIVQLIEKNVEARPDLQKEVAHTLLRLLAIRTTPHYHGNSEVILMKLEELKDGKKEMQVEGNCIYIPICTLSDAIKAAQKFESLTEEQADSLTRYLESLIRKNPDSLEMHLSKALGLPSEARNNPAHFNGFDKLKVMTALLSIHSSDHEEDFQMPYGEKEISEKEFRAHAIQYYTDRGYQVRDALLPGFMAMNECAFISVNITFGHTIMVSVQRHER